MHFLWGDENTHRPNLTLVFSLCQKKKLTQSNSLTHNIYSAMKNALILKKKNNTNFEFSHLLCMPGEQIDTKELSGLSYLSSH